MLTALVAPLNTKAATGSLPIAAAMPASVAAFVPHVPSAASMSLPSWVAATSLVSAGSPCWTRADLRAAFTSPLLSAVLITVWPTTAEAVGYAATMASGNRYSATAVAAPGYATIRATAASFLGSLAITSTVWPSLLAVFCRVSAVPPVTFRTPSTRSPPVSRTASATEPVNPRAASTA